MKNLVPSLLLSLFFISHPLSLFAEYEPSQRELNQAKRFYSSLNSSYKDDIEDIFNSYPIYTNIQFIIRPVDDNIVDKMFNDLDYTGKVGKVYAGSPYEITRVDDYYHAKVRDVVDGNIYILRNNKKKNHFIYLVKGYYDTFITLRGKMIVDVNYKVYNDRIVFNIKAYVIIDNTYLWRLARYVKSLPSFQGKIDQLIKLNVRATIRLGLRTLAGIKKDLKGKKF